MKHVRSFSFLLIAVAMFAGYAFLVSAAAPNGGYSAGATLDPDCAPGDTDCIVITSGGGSSQWTDVTAGSSLTLQGSGLDDVTLVDDDGFTGQFMMQVLGNAGDTSIGYTNRSGNFAAGDVVVGNTSGATATLRSITDINSVNIIFLYNVSGTFVNGETITNQTNSETLDLTSNPSVTTADSFLWYHSNPDTAGLLEMTGSSQVLFDNFTVSWASTTGHTVGDMWGLGVQSAGIYYTDGQVGIGTMTPGYDLDITGTFNATQIDEEVYPGIDLSYSMFNKLSFGGTLQGTGFAVSNTFESAGVFAIMNEDTTESNVLISSGAAIDPATINVGSTYIGMQTGNSSDGYGALYMDRQQLFFRNSTDSTISSPSTEMNAFLFDMSNPAIRLGSVDDDNWDQPNRGNRSIAIGFTDPGNSLAGPLASGDLSIAFGSGTTATGIGGVTIGFNSLNDSLVGVAIGSTNQLLDTTESAHAFGALNTVNIGAGGSFLVGKTTPLMLQPRTHLGMGTHLTSQGMEVEVHSVLVSITF